MVMTSWLLKTTYEVDLAYVDLKACSDFMIFIHQNQPCKIDFEKKRLVVYFFLFLVFSFFPFPSALVSYGSFFYPVLARSIRLKEDHTWRKHGGRPRHQKFTLLIYLKSSKYRIFSDVRRKRRAWLAPSYSVKASLANVLYKRESYPVHYSCCYSHHSRTSSAPCRLFEATVFPCHMICSQEDR
jgi:hypothetical protein